MLGKEHNNLEEFQEIYLSGGKLEFKKGPTGGVSIGYSGSNPWPMAMFQVCVSLEGHVLDIVPVSGLGPMRPYPQPSIIAWVISDRHGMFGNCCPQCKSYFRIDMFPGYTVCPYCGNMDKSINFLTDNQLRYIGAFCDSFAEAYNDNKDVILDLDKLADELPENKPQWLYSEEQQQHSHTCATCKRKYDILGEYALCPGCGAPNLADVFNLKMDGFEKQFKKANEELSDRHDREVEWEKLIRCISEFESMANQFRNYILRFPAIPKRKNALKSMSFQNILKANYCIRDWYGFEILEGVTEADRNFLNIMFNRRHVFTHNAGRVDQEYINNTGDKNVHLNQTLRVNSKEVHRLIPLVRECGTRLIKGYESIQ